MVTAEDCLSCRGSPCRRVKGIFTRPTLPTGYNLIARIPAKSCNITVQEIRSSTNYLAIRSSNGYIINGNWAVLPPGRYMGAGTGFYYTIPQQEGNELIKAPGPLKDPIDIMIIYQATNPGVEYEYWHPSSNMFTAPALPSPGKADLPNTGLHKSYGRGNTGINAAAYGSNTPGVLAASNIGALGINTGVIPGGNTGALVNPNPGGLAVTGHGQSFGPGHRSGTGHGPGYGPVRRRGSKKGDHNRGHIDHARNHGRGGNRRHYHGHRNFLQNVQPAYVASSIQSDSAYGGIPPPPMAPGSLPQLDPSQLLDNRVLQNQLDNNLTPNLGLDQGDNSNSILGIKKGPSWKVWKFTPCSKTCGGGEQQTVYICTSVEGAVVDESLCTTPKPPPQTVRCNPIPCPATWQLGEWSQCSVTCGTGLMTRTWACVQEVTPQMTRQVPPHTCPPPPRTPKLPLTQPCTMGPCTRWEVSLWSKCSVECGTGVVSRHVACKAEGRKVPEEQCNIQEKPPRKQLCHANTCAKHTWFYTDWTEECIGGCEDGVQTRRVWCSPGVNTISGECNILERPRKTRPCARADACAAAWFTGPWTPCSEQCSNGTRTREVVCVVFLRGAFRATLEIECNQDDKPADTEECNPDPCPPHWYYTDWSQCSRTCGRGARTRAVQCLDHDQKPSIECDLLEKPQTTSPCATQPCDKPVDAGCVDRFKNCILVQQARLCRSSYYRTLCCASCYQQ